ncbi:MAG: hypothetical protein JWQ98_3316 [Chlorobi bacterium]|nr:hypothetical protein [Chlorobiota bacterium]
MGNDENGIESLAMKGALNLNDLQEMLGTTSASVVTAEDWGITYNSGTGQLSEYCTLVANNPGNPITGVGMLAYSADGSTLYCLQYSNGFNSPLINTSIGTTLYNPQDGNQALCVVYGWTEQASFYMTKTLTIGNE